MNKKIFIFIFFYCTIVDIILEFADYMKDNDETLNHKQRNFKRKKHV